MPVTYPRAASLCVVLHSHGLQGQHRVMHRLPVASKDQYQSALCWTQWNLNQSKLLLLLLLFLLAAAGIGCRRTRGCASLQNQQQEGSELASNADLMASGTPQYAQHWPACRSLGICIEEECALVMDHPACCVVPCTYAQGTAADVHSHMAVSKYASSATTVEQRTGATTSGFWRSDELYCWR